MRTRSISSSTYVPVYVFVKLNKVVDVISAIHQPLISKWSSSVHPCIMLEFRQFTGIECSTKIRNDIELL